MARKAASREEKSARRQHILTCARPVFAASGYHDTAMSALARAAGVSVGALYLAFPDGKDGIFHALYEQALDRLAAVFDEALALPAVDVRGRVCMLLYTYISFFKTENDSYRILSGLFSGGDESYRRDPRLREKGEAILQMLEAPIEQGIRQGALRPADTRKTVVSLWCMFDGILSLSGKENLPALSPRFRDYYVHGINIILDGLFM